MHVQDVPAGIGEARNDVVAQLLGRRANGMTRCYLGQFVAARALLEQCHGLGDPALRSIGAGQDTYATMLAQLAVTLAHLGYIDQARVRLSEAFSEARRFRQGLTLPNVLVRANWIKSITRSTEMQQDTEELLALSTEHGFPLYLGFGLVYRGLWLNALGQAQEGLTLLQRGPVGSREPL